MTDDKGQSTNDKWSVVTQLFVLVSCAPFLFFFSEENTATGLDRCNRRVRFMHSLFYNCAFA